MPMRTDTAIERVARVLPDVPPEGAHGNSEWYGTTVSAARKAWSGLRHIAWDLGYSVSDTGEVQTSLRLPDSLAALEAKRTPQSHQGVVDQLRTWVVYSTQSAAVHRSEMAMIYIDKAMMDLRRMRAYILRNAEALDSLATKQKNG